MTDNKKEKSPIGWIVWVSSLLIIMGIIFSNVSPTTQIFKPTKLPQRMSGIFRLPADGTIISRDTNGQELRYQTGNYIHIEQIGTPGKFTFVNNRDYKSWSWSKLRCISGPAKSSEKIKLKSANKKEILIHVRLSRRA